ncbi:MAG: hypothetical protein WCG78_04625 [Candidatus Omnitrophota bacterium]
MRDSLIETVRSITLFLNGIIDEEEVRAEVFDRLYPDDEWV